MTETLAEWGSTAPLPLTRRQAELIAGSKHFKVAPDFTIPDHWRVTASQYVGAQVFDGLELRVNPKVGVRRLFELLSASLSSIQWSDEDAAWFDSADLIRTIAGMFAAQAERATRQGLLQGYQVRDESEFAVRGRIAIGRQLALHPGLPLPIEVTYDDYTTDTAENRRIAGACRLLLRLSQLPPLLVRRLQRMVQLLIDVTPTPPSRSLPPIEWTRLNRRYRPAVELADLILTHSSLEESGRRSTTGTAFMINMNDVFEDVVGSGLRAELARSGFEVTRKYPVSFETRHSAAAEVRRRDIGAVPDVVVERNGARCAVADVKYIDASVGVSTGEIFQAVSYATHLGLSASHLIYAERQPIEQVTVGDIEVRIHHLDLDTTPMERSRMLSQIADQLRSGMSRSLAGD